LGYNVTYKKSVIRDLKKLPKAEVRRILDKIEKKLSRDPLSNPVLKGRFAGLHRFRIGDYRVIYAVLGRDVLILKVGHRRDIYKPEL
jgi:mRNA interferase RelE/StbE